MRLLQLARFAIREVLQRTAADWRIQSTAGTGILLAVGLMAAAVIYSSALGETALRRTIDEADPIDTDLAVRLSHRLERPPYDDSQDFLSGRVIARMQPFLSGTEQLVESDTLFFEGLPQLEGPFESRVRGTVLAPTSLADHITMVAGRMPGPGASGELEVLVDTAGASLLDLSVGDEMVGFPALLQTIEGAPTVPVRIVGIFSPTDFGDEYWRIGVHERLSERGRDWTTLRLYADFDEMFDTLGEAIRGMSADFSWFLFLDRAELDAVEAGRLRNALRGAAADAFSTLDPDPGWDTQLDTMLRRYFALLVLTRIPLFLMVSLALGLLLYYLFLVAGFLGQARASETSLFRTRGASLAQLGTVIMLEGLVITIPAILIGPFAAWGIVAAIAVLFPDAAQGVSVGDLRVSLTVFGLGAAGGLLALVVFGITTVVTARHGVIAFTRAVTRPPQIPLLHRYYLDIALLAIIGYLWWEARSSGTFLVRAVGGEGFQLDFTLLLGPVLGVIAIGLIIFRAVPLLMRLVAWAGETVTPVWATQSLRQIARNPIPVSAMLVLVAFATSLGLLASTFSASLDRSQEDQARFSAGADVRVRHTLRADPLGPDGAASLVAERFPGVVTTTVGRHGGIGTGDAAMAVDPDTFAQVAWWRDDFADRPLPDLLRLLEPVDGGREPLGMALPADTQAIGLWVATSRLVQPLTLHARLIDARGVVFDTELGTVLDQGWRYHEGTIPEATGPRVSGGAMYEPLSPFRLATLWVGPPEGDTLATSTLFLDQITALTPDGTVEVASFQELGDWGPLEDVVVPGVVTLETTDTFGREGRRSAVVSWIGGTGATMHGIRFGPPEQPLRVLATPAFLEDKGLDIGDTATVTLPIEIVPIEIVGVVDYFPTTPPREGGFLVVDYRSLLDYVLLRGPTLLSMTNEVWASLGATAAVPDEIAAAIDGRGEPVRDLATAEALIEERTADPLLTAGWTGLLGLSFVTVVLAGSSGLLFFSYVDARERNEEYALLRTLGFSRLQVNGLLWFRIALIVLIGAGVGTGWGIWLSNALLPLLEIAEEGERVVPPMVLLTNWAALAVAYATLTAAALATFLVLGWVIARLELQQVLRAGRA